LSVFRNFKLEVMDRIPIVVRHILLSDTQLDAWAEGRIHRCNELAPIDEEPAPQIIVKILNEEEAFATGGHNEMSIPVSILFFFEDEHRVLEDDEPTIGSVIQQAKRTLIANYHLNAAPYNERLVKRIHRFETLDYGGEVLDGNRYHRFMVLVVDYRCKLDVRTREVTC